MIFLSCLHSLQYEAEKSDEKGNPCLVPGLSEKNLSSNISFNVSVDFFMNLRKFPFIPSLLRVFFLIMSVWLIFVKYFSPNLLIRLYKKKFKPIDMMDYIN